MRKMKYTNVEDALLATTVEDVLLLDVPTTAIKFLNHTFFRTTNKGELLYTCPTFVKVELGNSKMQITTNHRLTSEHSIFNGSLENGHFTTTIYEESDLDKLKKSGFDLHLRLKNSATNLTNGSNTMVITESIRFGETELSQKIRIVKDLTNVILIPKELHDDMPIGMLGLKTPLSLNPYSRTTRGLYADTCVLCTAYDCDECPIVEDGLDACTDSYETPWSIAFKLISENENNVDKVSKLAKEHITDLVKKYVDFYGKIPIIVKPSGEFRINKFSYTSDETIIKRVNPIKTGLITIVDSVLIYNEDYFFPIRERKGL